LVKKKYSVPLIFDFRETKIYAFCPRFHKKFALTIQEPAMREGGGITGEKNFSAEFPLCVGISPAK